MSIENRRGFDPSAKTRDQEQREATVDRLGRFLEKVKFDTSSEMEKIEWLKNIDFDKFMDMLFVINGILKGEKSFQRWKGEIVKSTVSIGGLSVEDPDLEPPEHADQEFKSLFEQVQETLSPDTLKLSAAKLYTGIIFAHMFADGNGRLARSIYAMMTTGEHPAKKMVAVRGRVPNEFAFVMSGEAMKALIGKEDLNTDNYRDYVVLKHDVSVGDMDVIKYIAARRVFMAKGVDVGDTIEMTTFDDETREAFKQAYENVRREMFWETQALVGDHSEWAIETLDKIVDDHLSLKQDAA